MRGPGREAAAGVVAVLLLAACLRAPVTAVGPLMERIGDETGLGPASLGLLGALPVLGFGLGSVLVPRPAARHGLERVIAAALVALAGAVVVRSLPVPGALWVGTAALGVLIAVGNVLAPAVVKRDHPRRIALLTACFTAVMSLTAATASGVAVPVSDAWGGGWRLPVAAFAGVIGVVALLWTARARRTPRPPRTPPGDPAEPAAPVWRLPSAWVVSAFMGLQSGVFFVLITWLPTVESSFGLDPAAAGWHMFLFQVVSMSAGLLLSTLMRGRTDLRALGVVVSLCSVAAMVGMVLAPGAALLWIPVAAAGSGGSLVLSLSLFGLRTAHPRDTARLSGMAQATGYVFAGGSALAAGWVGGTFAWELVLLLVGCLAVGQTVAVLGAARPGVITDT